MNAANLFAGVIFGCIGFAAFVYGKKQTSLKAMVIGILLIAFPYFISNAVLLYAVGILLTVSLFSAIERWSSNKLAVNLYRPPRGTFGRGTRFLIERGVV